MPQESQKRTDIEQHLPHQELEWRLQIIGWVAMAMLMLAAIAGFLGPGLMGKELLEERKSGLKLECDRFIHYQAPRELKIFLPSRTPLEPVSLFLNRAYVDQIEIAGIEPEPESCEIAGEQLVYNFHQSGSQGGTVIFRIQPTAFGKLIGEVKLKDGELLRFEQFVYP